MVDTVSSEISKLAEKLTNDVNEIQTSGIDLNGKSGKAMFSVNSMLPQANFSNKAELKFNIIGGYNISCVGDENKFSCILSKYKNSHSDKALLKTFIFRATK